MSKLLRITPEVAEQCRDEFNNIITSGSRIIDGKITYTKIFADVERPARVMFTADAWTKMLLLLSSFSEEVAWHGVAMRDESEGSDDYYIVDILVYPQTVTASTVDMDEEAYNNWIVDNIQDERFSNLYMQGHSHVMMGCSPSPTDLEHQRGIVSQLRDDQFYIFMIWNKKLESWVRIFDMRKNMMFDNKDVKVGIVDSGEDFTSFIDGAKEMVKKRTYTVGQYASGKGYYGSYQGSYQQAVIDDFPVAKPASSASVESKVAVNTAGSAKDEMDKPITRPVTAKEADAMAEGYKPVSHIGASSVFDNNGAMNPCYGCMEGSCIECEVVRGV